MFITEGSVAWQAEGIASSSVGARLDWWISVQGIDRQGRVQDIEHIMLYT
jgi:hypothetical protein